VARGGLMGLRIIVLLLLIVVLVFGGLIWFDYLGLLNVKETLSPLFALVGIGVPKKAAVPDYPEMLDEDRIARQLEALTLREEELDRREEQIAAGEAEVLQKQESLKEREQALEEREKSFNDRIKQYENRNASLRNISQNLVGMPPQKAVDRLLEMDDQDVIDLLRITDQIALESGEDSITAYWLSLMPAERAAEVQRKMLKKPIE